MFESISLTGLAKSQMFGYAAKVPFFSKKKVIKFKPGLNIIFGPNATGKSTIINMLAECMMARQGGISAITQASVQDHLEMFSGRRRSGTGPTDKFGLTIRHDGQPVCFVDPRHAVGLSGGAFDDDFFEAGVAETRHGRRRSHGQSSLARSDVILKLLSGKGVFPTTIIDKLEHVNDTWEAAKALVRKRMEPSIERGQPSILLDEPEANFSLIWQAELWSIVANAEVAEKFQVIVVTHSPLALGIPHANYIEMQPGYMAEVEGLLAEHAQRWVRAK